MIHYFREIRFHAVTIIIVTLIGVISVPTFAQAALESANCDGLLDKANQTQRDNCSNHPGCSMVLKLQKDCATMNGFLGRLRGGLSGRSEIKNNDVFEANTPVLTPNEALKTKLLAVQKIVLDYSKEIDQGKFTRKTAAGEEMYYEGGIKGGAMHGAGVNIGPNAFMYRGQVYNGHFEGFAQVITPDGSLFVGDFVGSRPQGNVVFQSSAGTILAGYQNAKKWSGVMELTLRNGNHVKELYSSAGEKLAIGAWAKAGQTAEAPAAPDQASQKLALDLLDNECVTQALNWQLESAGETAKIYKSNGDLKDIINISIRDAQREIALYKGRCARSSFAKESIAAAEKSLAEDGALKAEGQRTDQLVAEKQAEDAREDREAFGQVLGTLGQVLTNNANRKQGLAAVPRATPMPAASSGGGECQTEIDKQEVTFAAINQDIARANQGGGSLRQIQQLIRMTSQRMALLDRVCKGQPQYGEYASTKQAYDAAVKNCFAISTDGPTTCSPGSALIDIQPKMRF